MPEFGWLPPSMLRSLWAHRGLTTNLVRREIAARYRGSMLGLFWSFFTPVFMLLVYTFVFSVVFQARWHTGTDGTTDPAAASRGAFALLLFAGLIVFQFFADCFARAPGLVLANVNYVKKVVFPLEVLVPVAVGGALFHAAIGGGVWLLFHLLIIGLPHWTVVLFPLVLLPVVLLTLGVCWALASLGVYLRDVAQMVGVATTVLMFLSPIFYPLEALPEAVRPLLALNPLAPAIAAMRDVLFWGKLPPVGAYALYTFVGLVVAWAGFAWFQRTRRGFADVL